MEPTPTEPTNPNEPVGPVEIVSPTEEPTPATPNQVFQGAVIGGDLSGAQDQQATSPFAPQESSAKRGLVKGTKGILIGVAAVVVLGGASAAAYFGVVVPNQPQNVLKQAFINTLKQKQVSFTSSVKADDEALGSYKISMDGQGDLAKKALASKMTLTYSGATISAEVRYIDGDAYIKVGDLTTLVKVASAMNPKSGPALQKAANSVSNKWIAIDSTLVNEAGAKCVTNTNWTFTDKDIQLIKEAYTKHSFATIQSNSSDSVDGQASTKYDLDIDNKTGDQFVNSLKDLSMVQALNKCDSSTIDNSQTTTSTGKSKVTVWVDKSSKLINQISVDTNESGITGTAKVTMKYGPVSIAKPANATPLLQVLADLQKQLGGSGTSDYSGLLSGLMSGGATTAL